MIYLTLKYNFILLMKKLIALFFGFISIQALCQKNVDTVFVSFDKTVILIFDDKISHVDVGSADIIMDSKDKILKLAATRKDVAESSLFVETANAYYSFVLRYNNSLNPTELTRHFSLEKATIIKEQAVTNKREKNEVTKQENKESKNNGLEPVSNRIGQNESYNYLYSSGVSKQKIDFLLAAIYIHNDKLYFKLDIDNSGNISYDIDYIRFVIRSKKGTIKQAAVQEKELKALHVFNGDIQKIEGKEHLSKVYVFDKFTIADKKKLVIELWEKGGDRILSFNVDDNLVLNAKRFYE